MFGWIARNLEGTQSENWSQDRIGKRYVDRPLWWYRVWRYLWLMLMLTKKRHQQRRTVIIMWKVATYPQLLLSLTNEHRKWPWKQGWRLCIGSVTQADLVIGTAECPTCQQAKSATLLWHHPPGNFASHLPARWLHQTLPSWCFVFTGIDTSLDMDLPSLSAMLLPKPPSVDIQNALINIMEFHTALPPTNELIFATDEMWQWA